MHCCKSFEYILENHMRYVIQLCCGILYTSRIAQAARYRSAVTQEIGVQEIGVQLLNYYAKLVISEIYTYV